MIFNEVAKKDAIAAAQEAEDSRMKTLKVHLAHDKLTNKPEEDDLEGPSDLVQEFSLKKTMACRVCKGIPVAPVVQSKCCGELYCEEQCLARARAMGDE